MAEKLPANHQSKPFPGSLTPGWNDPPLLNNVTQPPGRNRLNLNRRIAFPVNCTSSSISVNRTIVSTSLGQGKTSAVGFHPPPSTGTPTVKMQRFNEKNTEKLPDDTDSVNNHHDRNIQ
ncbi:PREDICTED: uncharacterized protein LOC108978861 [Bactrocera latifrons]|uniref:uncharacterized protein LOC108978861 n=1 Tax=Bactrocera latifrons TaxID=174628 RepID=UPI0008DDA3F2|nr:PREDICTED: uncharacterized protein LOC108978861 [Bactrocera latifrons]